MNGVGSQGQIAVQFQSFNGANVGMSVVDVLMREPQEFQGTQSRNKSVWIYWRTYTT